MRLDAPAAFENAKDDGLPARAAAAFAANAATTEVGFIDFDGATHRRMRFALLGHADAKRVEEAVDGAATDMRELGHLRGLEIEGKKADDLAKFRLRNMRTENIAIEGCQY